MITKGFRALPPETTLRVYLRGPGALLPGLPGYHFVSHRCFFFLHRNAKPSAVVVLEFETGLSKLARKFLFHHPSQSAEV